MTARFECFGIKRFSRSAIKTTSICRFSLRKRTADVIVPTAEKRCNQTDLLTENKSVNLIFQFSPIKYEPLKFI